MTDADRLLSVTAVPGRRGRVVVEVVGEVDTFTAPLLGLCLNSQAAQPRLRELLVDLAGVTFLGAAAMLVLEEANHRCRERGASFVVLSGGRGTVLRPLEVGGLSESMAVDPDHAQGARTRGPRTTAGPRPRLRSAPKRRPGRVGR